jgi:thiol-disulfide isomerase/thioredoxin
MSRFSWAPFSLVGAVAAVIAAAPAVAAAQAIDGRWDATVDVKGQQIPFRLQLNRTSAGVKGVFYDGERPINPSSGGSFQGGVLKLDFADHAGALNARYEGGALRGTYDSLPFEARPHQAPRTIAGPNIAGSWVIPTASPKGEKAWRLVVRQAGGQTFATILRIDGDTGTLNGAFQGGKFHLSRFAGERPGLLEITPRPDGSLNLVHYDQGGNHEYTAVREAAAKRQGLAAPSDPTGFTTVQNKAEPFRFGGVDLSGKPVTQADPRFKGKVVLVNVMGSWCPNCHDEAPFLAELYTKYHARGLEIVGLDFEQPEQLQSLTRLKAFIARYNLRYTVLVGGERKDVTQKLPQAVGLNAWPTTFFLGRDGKPRSVHVGFPSRGSGPYEVKARADITREIESLLADKT